MGLTTYPRCTNVMGNGKMFMTRYILMPFVILVLAGCQTAAVKPTAVKDAINIPVGSDAKPIQLRKVIVKLNRGEKIGTYGSGLLCLKDSDLKWKGGQINVTGDDFTDVFREELEKAGYPVVGDPNALFEDPTDWRTELFVGGLINEMQANICYPLSGLGDFNTIKGGAYIKVNWQIYSTLQRRVIHEVTTEGSFESENDNVDSEFDPLINAFGVATQNLLADQQFHALVSRKTELESNSAVKDLTLHTTKLYEEALDKHVNDVRLAVVTVFVPGGHGSGFFVSNDGHLLTNEHVVRDAKFVQVKLTTGREILAEVIARDAVSDVALLQVEESGIPFLPIREDEISVGSLVYAIGSPLSEELSTTVSQGILSSYRNDRGKRLIQSDVNIEIGSSGGPLLDKSGNVIGLSVSGIMVGGASTGLNFFVPINDALAAIGVKVE